MWLLTRRRRAREDTGRADAGAAEAALPSLLGMGLDYSPALDRHDARRKVGVITRAEIVGRKIELGGYLFAKDFPEIVQEDWAGALLREWCGNGRKLADAWACRMRSPMRGSQT